MGTPFGFISKIRRNGLLSPKTSLSAVLSISKSKSDDYPNDDSKDCKTTNKMNSDQQSDGVPTDSDLDDEEFDILKQLPTWKKLKLSVFERRQRYRQKQKTLKRLKQQQIAENNKQTIKVSILSKSEINMQESKQNEQ